MKKTLLFLLILVSVNLLIAEDIPVQRDTTATGLVYRLETVIEEKSLDNGAGFSIYLDYPVFEGDDPLSQAINRYVYDLINTAYTGPDGEKTSYSDYHLLAKDKLKAWAQNQEDYELGIEWSIGIRISYTGEMITLSTNEYGYSGGAHGYSVPSYMMFDNLGRKIDWKNLLAPESQQQFQQFLLTNFVQPDYEGWEHDRNYILNPLACALTETGMEVIYEGGCYAEGFPCLEIPKAQIRPLLKQQYQEMYK